MDLSQILLKDEIQKVVADLKIRGRRSINSRQNLVVFRLACGCGLRRKEIAGLDVADFRVSEEFPAIRIRASTAKGRKARVVPLWWDTGTREDLLKWLEFRRDATPFLCQFRRPAPGRRLHEDLVARRWKTAIRVLGPERVSQLSIHCGRHSFCTHAVVAGRTIAEIRDAAGHGSVLTTDIYIHTAALMGSDAADLYA